MPTVIDTNVWVVAAGMHAEAGNRCVTRCNDRLTAIRRGDEALAVDTDFAILGEYYRSLPEQSAPCRILGELCRRAGLIDYRAVSWDASGDAVVPPCLAGLDRSDRKFAAVALACHRTACEQEHADADRCDGLRELHCSSFRVG